MAKCPSGHTLPRRGKSGLACSVMYCSDAKVEVKPERKKYVRKSVPIQEQRKLGHEERVERSKDRIAKQIAVQKHLPADHRVELASLTPNDALPLDGKETPEEFEAAKKGIDTSRIELAEGNASLLVRRRALPIPEGLDGEAADKFVAETLAKAAPEAIAELRHQMLYSLNPSVRRAAAQDLLDRAGHGKKEGGTVATAPVIVLVGGGVEAPPWAQKVQVQRAQVVDATPARKPEPAPGPIPFTVVPNEE